MKARRQNDIENNDPKGFIDVWAFTLFAFFISFLLNWSETAAHIPLLTIMAPFMIGLLAFCFQIFINRAPLIELYSKGYPYRKLKPYGVIITFLLFEFLLVWGLYTKQILPIDTDLILVVIIFIGAIAYYHLFVRMKISLRFLFLAVFIPIISAGTALGLGSYFNILEFIVPSREIGDMVFFDTVYWVIFYIFLQVVCEEPAFRGYIMQRLLKKGELYAIIFSSVAFALWRIPFSLFADQKAYEILLLFTGNIIMGAIFALLFIKGRNLLVAIIAHGIIDGLYRSFFSMSVHPGIGQYIKFTAPEAGLQLTILWFSCLLVGLILLTIVPRKTLPQNAS